MNGCSKRALAPSVNNYARPSLLVSAEDWPQELSERSDTQYVPGGATQNSIRVAQWLLQVPAATSYFGCVGSDKFADIMRKTAQKDGVNVWPGLF